MVSLGGLSYFILILYKNEMVKKNIIHYYP
jgi:hypothetical protein